MKIELITDVLPNLKQPAATPNMVDSLKAAAVLLVLHKIEHQWHILLTTRAPHLSSHAGQISFPGGRYEDIDCNLMETAIRETEEEISLDRTHLNIISQLDEQTTLTGYRIYPFIAITENLPSLVIDRGEVDEVFSAPLDFLFDINNQQLENAFYKNKNYNYYKIIWQEKIIWGATARMIVNLSKYFKNI